MATFLVLLFFFSSRRRHTRYWRDWSSDVCSSDLEVCRRIRRGSDIPILMLTARDEDVDKIIGLEVGADDYLTKPFNPRELVARVKSILRRSTPERRQIESKVLRHGDLTVDAGRREVRVGDEEIQLAP